MKRLVLILAVSLALLPLLNSPAFGRTLSLPGPVVSKDHGLNIDLWTDRAQDEIYDVGDSQELYFRANSDCYVSLYHIDTDGNVEVLFPRYPDDGFVFGGVTHRLPDYYDDWDLRARGPDGIGYLHAAASHTPNAFSYNVHRNHYHLDVDPVAGDPYLAINSINARMIHRRHLHASATVSFFVGRHSWYPRYMCYDCHGRSAHFNPYRDACPRYNVRPTRNYDYWWGYDYHPAMVHFSFGGPFWRFELRTVPVHRHRRSRYLNYAYGYGNYFPIRPLYRSPRVVVYKSKKWKKHRSFARHYKPVKYRDTKIRRTGNSRTQVRPRTTTKTRTTRTTTRTTRTKTNPRSTKSRSTVKRSTNNTSTASTRSRTSKGTPSRKSSVSTTRSRTSTGTSTRPTGTSVSRSRSSTSSSKSTSTAPSSSSRRNRSAVSSAPRSTPRMSTRSTPSSSSSSRGRTLSSGRSSRDDRSTRNSRSSGSSSRTTRSSSRSSSRSR